MLRSTRKGAFVCGKRVHYFKIYNYSPFCYNSINRRMCERRRPMNDALWKALREILLAEFGADIDEADFRFSTQNYAFIFPDKPYMIRVSMSPAKTRQEIMSELIWVDDLKQFKETICEPSVSLHGKLMHEFEIEGVTYRASMFRTARGRIKGAEDITPMYFICVGELLGAIHHVSTNEQEIGMKFKRPDKRDQFAQYKELSFPVLSAGIRKKIEEIEEKVNALPDELGSYGLCHGDFHANNFFVEGNNVWLFDFDGCAYADYMYDIACFIQDCMFKGYGRGRDARQVLEQNILPYFRLGYELNKKDGKTRWDQLELMISYRVALGLMAMTQIKECGVFEIEKARNYYQYLLTQDDIIAAMTQPEKKAE